MAYHVNALYDMIAEAAVKLVDNDKLADTLVQEHPELNWDEVQRGVEELRERVGKGWLTVKAGPK